MDNFVHLHNHSSFSLLDGIIQPKDLAKKAKQLQQQAVALTDHGTIAGIIKFYRACMEENIKPIIGCEIYIDFTDEFDWIKKPNHLTVICKNNIGFNNLVKMHNYSTLEKGYKRIRVTFNELCRFKEGLIILSGCPNSIINKLIDNDKDPEEMIQRFQNHFEDDFYIELMYHGLDIEKKLLPRLRDYAGKFGIKKVATNDSHYLNKEDSEPQYIATLDAMKKNINDSETMKKLPDEFYLKTREQMGNFYEDELNNTLEIANKCNINMEKFKDALPKTDRDIDEFLICGLDKLPKAYLDRYESEKQIIQEANLENYFGVVCDFLDFAKQSKIIVGPCRGSVGSSLYAFMHGIHKVNPIKYGLFFSRFYNHGRKGGMPDIDMDFCKERIGDMYQYLQNKYGSNNVAHIGISGKAGVKGALKMVCRTLGIDFQISNNYSKMVPEKPENIFDILQNPEAKNLYNTDPLFKKAIDITGKTEGINFSFGIHASGIIISKYDLTDKLPLRKEDGTLLSISYWDMEDIEYLGFMKFDFLTIDTLDVIKKTLEMIGKDNYDYIIKNFDPTVFKFIQEDSHVGLFQITSSGISKLVRDMKPDNIVEISHLVALYRPGPLSSGFHNAYVNRKFGLEEIKYDHPLLEPILNENLGLCFYQENVIKICIELGGFSETDADVIRKIIGKKKSRETELIQKMKEKFINGALSKGIPINIVEEIWGQMEAHSSYSFNKSHSVGYGYITYITAYLKKYYPSEFLASCLTMSKNEIEVAKYLNECKRLGIKIHLPNIKNSKEEFVVKNGEIYFSLNSIKNTGDTFLKKILSWQQKAEQTLENFVLFIQPNKRILESLIRSGSMDCFIGKGMTIPEHRGKLLHNLVNTNQIAAMQYTGDLFGDTQNNLWKPLEELEMMYDERKYLGTFITSNPLDRYKEQIEKSYYQVDLNEIPPFKINIIGIIDNVTIKYDKNSKEMAIVKILQYNNVPINVVFWNSIWKEISNKVKEGKIMGVSGKIRDAGNFITEQLIMVVD